jgi:hypothetical protein
MNIGNLWDISHPILEDKPASRMHSKVHQWHRQLTNELQANLSDEGYIFPQQPQTNINTLESNNPIGSIVYNSNRQTMQLSNTGTFLDIYTRPQQLTTTERLAIPADLINGTWVYDSTLNELFFGINGAWRQVAFI